MTFDDKNIRTWDILYFKVLMEPLLENAMGIMCKTYACIIYIFIYRVGTFEEFEILTSYLCACLLSLGGMSETN